MILSNITPMFLANWDGWIMSWPERIGCRDCCGLCLCTLGYINWVENVELRWFPWNIRAIMAQIKLPNKPHGMVMFWTQLRKTYRDLSSQADTVSENWTWSYPYFNKNRRFGSVKNTITHVLIILTRFDINFLENAWEFNRGVT